MDWGQLAALGGLAAVWGVWLWARARWADEAAARAEQAANRLRLRLLDAEAARRRLEYEQQQDRRVLAALVKALVKAPAHVVPNPEAQDETRSARD